MYSKLILLAFLIFGAQAFAALPATTTIWEVQGTSGNDANGGCFVFGSSGTDKSQSAPTIYTDLAVSGTAATSAGNPFNATDVGNCLTAPTGCTAGIYYVVSVSVVTATLDRSAAGACVGAARKGGPLATLAQLNTNMQGGNTAWVKAEATYSISASVVFNFTQGSFNSSINGYTSTRGDAGMVTAQASAGSFIMFNMNPGNNQVILRNFIADCNAQSNCTGFQMTNAYQTFENIWAKNFTLSGIIFANQFTTCRYCYASGGSGTGGGFSFTAEHQDTHCVVCVSVDNSVAGFNGIPAACEVCIAGNNSGATSDGFLQAADNVQHTMNHSVAFNNGRDGFRYSGTAGQSNPSVINSIFVSNAGYGINYSGISTVAYSQSYDYNAFFGNGTAALNGLFAGAHDVTLSGDPFVSGAADNFALNSTAGAGAALKGVGFPGVLKIGGTGAPDIGALQSTAATSNGSASGFVQ